MKKLMLAVAVVCAAVASQAATANWANSGSATAKIKNGSAVWSTLAATDTAKAYLLFAADLDTVKAALDNGTFTGANTIDSTTAISSTSGKITSKDVTISTSPTSYQMLLVYTDKTSGLVTYQFASSPVTANAGDSTAEPPIAQANPAFAATSFSASGWTTVSGSGSGGVPEPTSGLLLLLGVAGLALRRKSA